MIQRIQSIYLLLAAILMAVTVFSPFLHLMDDSADGMTVYSCGIANKAGIGSTTSWGVLFFLALGVLLPLINIFLFKKRKIQQKIGSATSLVILFFYITTYVYYHANMAHASITSIKPEYGIVLPAIALIFNILAVIKIKKDEKLVRSLDRIR